MGSFFSTSSRQGGLFQSGYDILVHPKTCFPRLRTGQYPSICQSGESLAEAGAKIQCQRVDSSRKTCETP